MYKILYKNKEDSIDMKKNYVKLAASLFAAIMLTTGCTNTGTNGTGNTNTDGTTVQSGNIITESDARQIALERAGLETATFTEQRYDSYEQEYEFEFYTDEKKYDCNVSATDGRILEYDEENILNR